MKELKKHHRNLTEENNSSLFPVILLKNKGYQSIEKNLKKIRKQVEFLKNIEIRDNKFIKNKERLRLQNFYNNQKNVSSGKNISFKNFYTPKRETSKKYLINDKLEIISDYSAKNLKNNNSSKILYNVNKKNNNIIPISSFKTDKKIIQNKTVKFLNLPDTTNKKMSQNESNNNLNVFENIEKDKIINKMKKSKNIIKDFSNTFSRIDKHFPKILEEPKIRPNKIINYNNTYLITNPYLLRKPSNEKSKPKFNPKMTQIMNYNINSRKFKKNYFNNTHNNINKAKNESYINDRPQKKNYSKDYSSFFRMAKNENENLSKILFNEIENIRAKNENLNILLKKDKSKTKIDNFHMGSKLKYFKWKYELSDYLKYFIDVESYSQKEKDEYENSKTYYDYLEDLVENKETKKIIEKTESNKPQEKSNLEKMKIKQKSIRKTLIEIFKRKQNEKDKRKEINEILFQTKKDFKNLIKNKANEA